MFRIIAAVIVLAVLVILGVAFGKPDSFSVGRSAIINAPAERIFPLLDDFNYRSA